MELTENTVSTKLAEYIGNELFCANGDNTLPDGWNLPATLFLQSAHCRTARGLYLGRSWYLISFDRTSPPETIDLIHFAEVYDDENLSFATAFLAAHGYKCVDDFVGEFARSQPTQEH